MDYYLFQAGRTALMLACKGGHISVVQYLEAQGADVNVKDGVSPLLHLRFFTRLLQRIGPYNLDLFSS